MVSFCMRMRGDTMGCAYSTASAEPFQKPNSKCSLFVESSRAAPKFRALSRVRD